MKRRLCASGNIGDDWMEGTRCAAGKVAENGLLLRIWFAINADGSLQSRSRFSSWSRSAVDPGDACVGREGPWIAFARSPGALHYAWWMQ